MEPEDPSVPLAQIRHELEERGLSRADLDADPLVQVQRWYDHAVAVGVYQPEAMALATATADGRPSVRFVLLRHLGPDGFTFFTNEDSRKGREILETGRAAIVFAWHEISRQVRAGGAAEPISADESDAYFATRARGSQLSAWASPQSEVVADRAALTARRDAEVARWDGREVERPPRWGGFRIVPDEIELWQGRADRYHDRFRYRRDGLDEPWRCERLGP
jgi:pyridoxamine 5'-phosphate oxidase